MLSSVEFDDLFCWRCIKISDVVADGFLPIELPGKNLFFAASGTIGVARRRLDLSARSELWS